MGVMDNLLHKESARVALLSNGSHCEGRSGRSSSPRGSTKYKQRRVSAVRDFPPGCGWFAFQINRTPNEDIIVDTICPEANNLLHSSNHLNRPELVGADAKGTLFPESENLKPLECKISNVSKNLNVVNIGVAKEEMFTQNGVKALSPPDWPIAAPGNIQEKLVTRNYPPRRRVSAIRDFPPFCGQNVSCLGKEECINVIASLKSIHEEKPVTEDRSLRGTLETDMKQMEEDGNHGDAYTSKLSGDVSRITCDKDQADLEGHAAMETKKHDEFETSSKIDMKVAEEDSGENSIKSPQETEQYRFDCKTHIKSSSKDVVVLEENPVRDIVVYAQDEQVDRNYPDLSETDNQFLEGDSDNVQLASNLVIVHGLMASPNCPWRQGKKVYKPNPAGVTDESKRKKHDLPQLCISAFNTKNEAESSRGPLTKKNTSPDGEADHVMGPLVIWNGEDYHGHDEAYKNFRSGERKRKKHDLLPLRKSAFKTKNEAERSEVPMSEKNTSPAREADHVVCPLVIWNGEDSLGHDGPCKNSHMDQISLTFDVNLLPSRPISSMSKGPENDVTGTRNKVRETLRLFQAVCRKLLQEEEAKSNGQNTHKRIDYLAARILKDKGKYVNVGKQIIGSVPGVEVGDEFHYRIELNIIGLHRQIQGGIDYIKHKGKVLATSIVASGGYDDDLDNSDVLTYTGQGGNVMNGGKEPEDQKLERGNLALVNSTHEKNPVRVIRGETKASDSARTYIYDGLYLVERYWQDLGPHGKLVFKFRLARIQGQPELAWKVVKKCKKFKVREGVCVTDISQGKELIPICAVNTIDDEKPPPFTYTTGIIYPDWCHPVPSKGCDCTNRCSDSGKCSCATKNGGEIPYNHNGAIVEVKPLVYECGPACKCPPSCYNRVSQHGIKFQLEVFKTESRGWGVRSLNSIASGSFICEYVGELLEEKEAEKRTGNDEYLFDIGNNDSSLWDGLSTLMPDAQSSSCGVVEDGGFTIDAAQYGNVGRFINHSCSPNLYAQNVLYDHEDKRIPHIMLFAAENIPPLQELTYHYNYVIDQVHDSDGNIKKKSCYCGSSECTGRLY